MTAVQSRQQEKNGAVVLPSWVLAALDLLDRSEQEAIEQVLAEPSALLLAPQSSGETEAARALAGRLQRISGSEQVYSLEVTADVLLLLKFLPGGSIEVLDVVRPEMLRRMFSRNDAAHPHP